MLVHISNNTFSLYVHILYYIHYYVEIKIYIHFHRAF